MRSTCGPDVTPLDGALKVPNSSQRHYELTILHLPPRVGHFQRRKGVSVAGETGSGITTQTPHAEPLGLGMWHL